MNEAKRLIEIVEGIDGAMEHGTWRDEKGVRLKDTKEWVGFYNSAKYYGDADELRDLKQAIMACRTIADFNAVKETVKAIDDGGAK